MALSQPTTGAMALGTTERPAGWVAGAMGETGGAMASSPAAAVHRATSPALACSSGRGQTTTAPGNTMTWLSVFGGPWPELHPPKGGRFVPPHSGPLP